MTGMHKVARLDELSEDRGRRVEVGSEKIMLVRVGDDVQAYQADCPHAGAPLEAGAICNGHIVCPWHKAAFRLSDGALIEPPALDALARYPVQLTAVGDVLVSTEKYPFEYPGQDSDRRTVAIIGAGAAGTTAALALREQGFGGQVVLIGQEAGPAYDRTALSKFVMAGQMKPDAVPALKSAELLDAQQIRRITARADRLDVAARRIHLSDASTLAYDMALVATGGAPRRLDLPGAELAGVHVLRSRQDAADILADIRPGARAVILGASFIGLEVASALRDQKVSVTVASPEEVPFAKQFGPQIGAMFRTLHSANGVVFHLGSQAVRLEGAGRVARVVLQDGAILPADVVIAGVGVRPATDFIDGLQLAQDGGIPVDAGMRAAEGLYAAGDVAQFPLAEGHAPIRIEHWRVAQQHARIAAHNMLGGDDRYDGVPFFWTYHYGKRFEYLGHADAWDEVVIEGDLNAQKFVALLVRQGGVAAVVACDRERATAALIERMRRPVSSDEALLLVRAD